MALGLPLLGAVKPAAAAGARPLRLLTYNIRTAGADEEDALLHNDWPHRKAFALRMLKDLDSDVIGLQEATDGQVKDLEPGFAVLRQEELALLYRADRLEVLEGGFLTLGAFGQPDPWGERWALWQRFRPRPGGPSFLVVVTHLSTAGDQVPQADQVINLALAKQHPGEPTVVMGDFNFDASTRLAARGFADALPDHRGTFHAFKGGRGGPRLDVIGLSSCRAVQAKVDTRRMLVEGAWVYPSDHYPVMATVVLEKGRPRSRVKH
jgi:hypothetical protein